MTASSLNAAEKKSALDPRTLFMIVAAICLVLLVLYFMLRFKAKQEEVQSLNDQIETSATQLADLQSKQSQLPGLRKEVADLQEKQNLFATALPDKAKMGEMLRNLRDSVVSSQGKINALASTQNNAVQNLPTGVQAIDIKLDMSGRFAPIYQTLQSIETMNRFTVIKDVNVSLPAPNDVDPNLDGVINMTTYIFDPKAVAATGAVPAAGGTAAPAPAAPAAPGGKS